MTIVAQSFSENVEYTFHVDNGKRVGVTDGNDSNRLPLRR